MGKTETPVIVAARRTPIGKFLGAYADASAVDLGVAVVQDLLKQTGVDPHCVNEVIFGNARQAGGGPNPARQICYRAGLPETVPAFTVNKACASSLKAVALACQAVMLGDAEVVIAGGAESMTRVPFLLDRMRLGYRLGHSEVIDGMYRDGFLCPLCGEVMGKTAENLVEKYGISREEQDRYAVESQNRCEAARRAGKFKDEIVPFKIAEDEHPRDGITMDSMKKLAPVFKENGTVHAGNSSGITDGAAAVMVMSEAKAMALNLHPMARMTGYVSVGVDPKYMGIGPVPAVRALEKKTGVRLDQYDLIELNEAFASQVLACARELSMDMNRVNVNGGAIALGHPIGATGVRIVVTLLHEMKRRQARRGLATLCVSGGLGMAVSFEAIG